MTKDESRIIELRELINKYNYEYYVLDNPTVSDKEYDEVYYKLVDLEEDKEIELINNKTNEFKIVNGKYEKISPIIPHGDAGFGIGSDVKR